MSSPGRHGSESFNSLSQFDFHARVAEHPGVSLVMFGSPDCGGCRHLRQVLCEVRRREPGWELFEVDAQRDAALTHEFEVFHLPTVFLYHHGEFHSQLAAEARPSSIISATRSALREPAQEAP